MSHSLSFPVGAHSHLQTAVQYCYLYLRVVSAGAISPGAPNMTLLASEAKNLRMALSYSVLSRDGV